METINVLDIKKTLSTLRNLRSAGRYDEFHDYLWGSAEKIREYLYSFELAGSDSRFLRNYVDDALPRFFRTIDLLAGYNNGRILEIGANPYLLTILLKKLTDFDLTLTNFFSHNIYDCNVGFGEQLVRSVLFEEEYQFKFHTLNVELSDYPFEEVRFDKILFCEVLEHIIVEPLSVFSKLHSILRVGGRLVITTPNACRLINFAHMLAGKNFFDRYHSENGVYGRHNREFSINEVKILLESNGFNIVFAKTMDRYNYDLCEMFVDSYEEQVKLPWSAGELRGILERAGGDQLDRGDNIYVIAEKVQS